MVEADDVLIALVCLPRDKHELPRIYPIAIVQRVGTLVLAAHDGFNLLHAIVTDLSQQYAATLVRVSLFAMTAKLLPFRFADPQRHGSWSVVTVRPRHPEVAEARRLSLERCANSKYWVDFEDFSFYRMDVVDVYYVGGFGVMGWVPASEYDQAQPDPLADATGDILQHMNADHKDALILLARVFAGH